MKRVLVLIGFIGTLSVGGLGASTVLASAMSSPAVAPSGGSVAAPCTIAYQANRLGFSYDQTVVPGLRAADAANNALAAEPGAAVAEKATGRFVSSNLPTVNGHNVVIMRLTNVPADPVSGPVGQPRTGPSGPPCVIAVYDADTGEMLVEMRTQP